MPHKKNEISKWADEAMFRSESHNAAAGPRVHLLFMNADPLGQVAACAKMYLGEVVRSLDEITNEERHYYMREVQKTKLKMPMEAVHFHFMIENVTRAFTHQLVRQRTAAYAQESMRFAVVEDMNQAVALPPSLGKFNTIMPDGRTLGDQVWDNHTDLMPSTDKAERQYIKWRKAVDVISETYNDLVNDGMPAEDARGLMPTNIITRVHYTTNLRNLVEHAGNRLCTQAQFEWRLVFAQIKKAIREYGAEENDRWQFKALSELLVPACYLAGHCVFDSDMDRKCSIRRRVQANAEINRPSSEWGNEYHSDVEGLFDVAAEHGAGVLHERGTNRVIQINDIQPREWLTDPNAAR